jgi:hypothetical protein
MHVRSLMTHSAVAMKRRDAYKAMSTWLAWNYDRREALRRAANAAKELRGIGTRRGWNQWVDVRDAKRLLHRRGVAVKMWRERAALRTWTQHRMELQYMNHMVRSLRNMWTSGGRDIRRALNTWRDGRRSYLALQKTVGAMTQQRIRIVFNTWIMHASSKALDMAKFGMRVSLSHLLNRRLSQAWNKWASVCRWPLVVDKMIAMLEGNHARRAIAFWRLDCKRGRAKRFAKRIDIEIRASKAERDTLGIELHDSEGATSTGIAMVVELRAEVSAAEQKAVIEKKRAEEVESQLRNELMQEMDQAASERLQAEKAQAQLHEDMAKQEEQLRGEMASQEKKAQDEMAKQKHSAAVSLQKAAEELAKEKELAEAAQQKASEDLAKEKEFAAAAQQRAAEAKEQLRHEVAAAQEAQAQLNLELKSKEEQAVAAKRRDEEAQAHLRD